MAGLFKINPLIEEENLLGIHKKQGMFDDAFAGMGRAPVNELFAGKHSAAIDDRAFEEAAKAAEIIRQGGLFDQQTAIRNSPDFNKIKAEQDAGYATRERITDETGLMLYPGHFRSDETAPIYMSEFSDKDSKFRGDGWVEHVRARAAKEEPVALSDVFEHDELYRHYPEAQLIPVYLGEDMKEGHRGSYYPPHEGRNLGAIVMNPNATLEDQRETLLHELQHFIQAAEGWEGGGSHSTELGIDYGNELLKNRHKGPMAEHLADIVEDVKSKSEGILPIEKEYDMGQKLAYNGYSRLTGEQLARDATKREADGHQTTHYYNGPIDTGHHGEYGQWNKKDSTFEPMASMPPLRATLQERGLLGPWVFEGDDLKVKEGFDVSDPYVEQYMNLLKKKKK